MSDSYKTDCTCIRCKRARRDMLEVVEGPANVPGGVLSMEPGTVPGVSIRRGIPLPPAERTRCPTSCPDSIMAMIAARSKQ